MAVARLSDTYLSYWEVGAGPRSLVMHGGLGIDHSAYRPGLDILGEDIRLVYYDHRCHGQSGRPPLSTLTLARLADDADDLRRHLGEQRIGVLGHSFGGFIAYEFAARHPDRLAFLIIVCSSPSVDDYLKEVAQTVEARATPAMREVLALPPPTTSDEWAARQRVLLPLFFHRWDPSYGRALIEGVIHNYEAAVAPGIDLTGWNRWDSLASIEVPTLIVVGRHDFIPHLPRAERAAKLIPKATLAVMENSGHYPWLEEPDAFASAVRQWLNSNTRQ